MNVTFNTTNYSRPSFNNNVQHNQTRVAAHKNQPTFTAMPKVPESSSLFNNFSKKYDDVAEWIAKNFTSKVIDSKPINYLADKFKDSKNLFQHCLTIGSLITSGLYMYKTATNEKLDKDRRNTLTVNQGLTFLVSTIGAYSLDKAINPWWENQSAKFISSQLNDEKFYTDFVNNNNAIKAANKALKEEAKRTGKHVDLKSTRKALDALYDSPLYKNLLDDAQSALNTKVKGFGALKSMIVFGLVYRYIVPVAVTKPANKLCEIYLEHKQKNKEQKAQQA